MRRLVGDPYCSDRCSLADRMGVILFDISNHRGGAGGSARSETALGQFIDRASSTSVTRAAFLASAAVAASVPLKRYLDTRFPSIGAATREAPLELARPFRSAPLREEFQTQRFLAVQKQEDSSWKAPGGAQPAWNVEEGWLNPRGMALYQPSAGSQNGLVSLNVRILAGAAGLLLRAQDFRNYYTVRLGMEGADPSPEMVLEAVRVEGGKESVIHEARVPRVLEGLRSMYAWTVKMEGDFFCAFVGNSPIASWRDKKLERGAVGLAARQEDSYRVFSSSMQLA